MTRTSLGELVALTITPHLPRGAGTVGEVEEEWEFQESFTSALLEHVVSVAELRDVTPRIEVRKGHPTQEIVRAAKAHRSDLIVLGHKGRSGVWGLFLGSTADKVSRHAPCSVLIVR